MTPRVTVLMSVYNGERYLREAINSILGQTYTDFEFIIVDDGSTDSSPDIIAAYDDRRIRLIRNEKNVGLTASLNKGLDAALGEYVARMDCDDISLPERLAKQVAFMDANPDVGASSTHALDIDKEGHVIGTRETLTGAQLDRFYWRTSLVHPAAIIRFAQLREMRYDSRLRYAQDYDLWLRIKAKYRLDNLAEVLLHYRVHDESITRTRVDEQLRSVYDSLCRHLGGPIIAVDEFQALLFDTSQVNPLRRTIAMMKLAKGIHKPYRYFISDDLIYARRWLGAQKIYRIASQTWLFKLLRYAGRQARAARSKLAHPDMRSHKTV